MKNKRKNPDARFFGNCPICSKKFSPGLASTLSRMYGVRTVYVECEKCKSSVVLGIVKNIPGVVTTVGMLTDMTKEDIRRAANMAPITADDVLEMHKYLES